MVIGQSFFAQKLQPFTLNNNEKYFLVVTLSISSVFSSTASGALERQKQLFNGCPQFLISFSFLKSLWKFRDIVWIWLINICNNEIQFWEF